MASSRVPVAELRRLLTAVSDHGAHHLVEVESDLAQTTFLLSGAIEKLGDSFMAIHAAVADQQQQIEALLSVTDIPQETHKKIMGLREKIGAEVNAAVTSLQFQDMTSQLIARVIKRVDGLKESLSVLATHGEGMGSEHEHEEILNLLEEMSSSLSTRDDALKGGIIKSVAQQDMSSGEIEMF